jgi:hypothetical protein
LEEKLMPDSLNTATALLRIEHERRLALLPRAKLYAVIIGFLNLLMCGFLEKTLRTDSDGRSLSLFLFSHLTIFALLSLSYFITNTEILHKSKLFPLASAGKLGFVMLGCLRQPFALAFGASNALFLVVLFRQTPVAALTAVVLYALSVFITATLIGIVFLVLERKNQSATIAIVIVLLLVAIVLVTATLIGSDNLLALPLAAWCVTGIRESMNGNHVGSVAVALRLVAVLAVLLFVGKRFV